MIEIIGYTAAFLTASTMMPQILKSLRTKSVKDISIAMLSMYIVNTGLWVSYGILIGATPIIIADGLAFTAGATQLFLRYRYKDVKTLDIPN